jgi:hypothetical protein
MMKALQGANLSSQDRAALAVAGEPSAQADDAYAMAEKAREQFLARRRTVQQRNQRLQSEGSLP